MKFFSHFAVVAFSLAQTVLSSPLERRVASSKECAVVNEIVDVLKLVKATPFCSSFLAIPVATVISTATVSTTATVTTSPYTFTTVTAYDTTATVDVTTGTTTLDVTTTVSTTTLDVTTTVSTLTFDDTATVSTITLDATTTVTSDVTSTVTASPVAGKRNVEERAPLKLPPYLAGFASAAISTACSCLSIPQSTSRRTTTVVDTLSATAISSVAKTQTTATTVTISTAASTQVAVPETATSTILEPATVTSDILIPETATTTIFETATVTGTAVATICPNPIQNPGFESGSAAPWVVKTDTSASNPNDMYGTAGEVYANSELIHSGTYSYLFESFSSDDNSLDGPIGFSLSQEVTINTCLPRQGVLTFWANFESEETSCTFQACIGSTCLILNAVEFSSGVGHNGFYQYSVAGASIDEPTSLEISVSANGGYGGSVGDCAGTWLIFDDFSIS